MNKLFINNKFTRNIFYLIIAALSVVLLFYVIAKTDTNNFFSEIEARTFDARQKMIAKDKKVSKDIVIIHIDDASLEYLLEKQGEWPFPRRFYAKIVDYLEEQNPDKEVNWAPMAISGLTPEAFLYVMTNGEYIGTPEVDDQWNPLLDYNNEPGERGKIDNDGSRAWIALEGRNKQMTDEDRENVIPRLRQKYIDNIAEADIVSINLSKRSPIIIE